MTKTPSENLTEPSLADPLNDSFEFGVVAVVESADMPTLPPANYDHPGA
ncbi:hypothetical protein [Nocardia sp. XZ_19_385]|nr:hypothetical protein [Nocardia sp. XZ_19_385]